MLADNLAMIDDTFFPALMDYVSIERQLTRYLEARAARHAVTEYDQRTIAAERVRNLALLAHAWHRSVPALVASRTMAALERAAQP